MFVQIRLHCIIYDGRNKFKLFKVIEEKCIASKESRNRLEGYYTVTRHLLERINHNRVENQISSVEDNFGSYAIKVDKLVLRIDLIETKLNQYVHK